MDSEKQKAYIKSFRKAARDKETMAITEEGIADYAKQLEEAEAGRKCTK